MTKEVELVKTAIEYLLGGELLPENGWSEEDVQILENLLESDFEIVKKKEKEICMACYGTGWYDNCDKKGKPIPCGACQGTGVQQD